MPARESAYRRKSKTCLAAAEATHPKVKSVMLQIAAGYEVMAGRVDSQRLPESPADDAA
jgi:hypothetical protein